MWMGKLICMRERERKKTEAEQQKMPLIENPIKILIEVNSVKMWLIQCIQLFTPKWWYAVIDFKIASKMGEFMGKHYQIKNESEDKQKAAPFSPPKKYKTNWQSTECNANLRWWTIMVQLSSHMKIVDFLYAYKTKSLLQLYFF